MRRIISTILILTFAFSTSVRAEGLFLPAVGQMVNPSKAFTPAILKGIRVHPDDPLTMDFIVDSANSGLSGQELTKETTRLVKYFLSSMTVPEKDLWVNLSPYEKDRIVPLEFGQTEMGRDLLAQDYVLKQITASLIYPESESGKAFWNKVYKQAQEKFGTTEVPVNTFNKVWIVPADASVYVSKQKTINAFVVDAKLKVMLEEDYLALKKTGDVVRFSEEQKGEKTQLRPRFSQIIREVVIPILEKEINEGANFSRLRQIYKSLILANWYKNTLKQSILTKVYADKNKIKGLGYTPMPARGHVQEGTTENVSPGRLEARAGLNMKAPQGNNQNDVERIYQQYLQAYKKGVFNYIKDDFPPLDGEGKGGVAVPRKYFSGGASLAMTSLATQKIRIVDSWKDAKTVTASTGDVFAVIYDFNASKFPSTKLKPPSAAMLSIGDIINSTNNAFLGNNPRETELLENKVPSLFVASVHQYRTGYVLAINNNPSRLTKPIIDFEIFFGRHRYPKMEQEIVDFIGNGEQFLEILKETDGVSKAISNFIYSKIQPSKDQMTRLADSIQKNIVFLTDHPNAEEINGTAKSFIEDIRQVNTWEGFFKLVLENRPENVREDWYDEMAEVSWRVIVSKAIILSNFYQFLTEQQIEFLKYFLNDIDQTMPSEHPAAATIFSSWGDLVGESQFLALSAGWKKVLDGLISARGEVREKILEVMERVHWQVISAAMFTSTGAERIIRAHNALDETGNLLKSALFLFNKSEKSNFDYSNIAYFINQANKLLSLEVLARLRGATDLKALLSDERKMSSIASWSERDIDRIIRNIKKELPPKPPAPVEKLFPKKRGSAAMTVAEVFRRITTNFGNFDLNGLEDMIRESFEQHDVWYAFYDRRSALRHLQSIIQDPKNTFLKVPQEIVDLDASSEKDKGANKFILFNAYLQKSFIVPDERLLKTINEDGFVLHEFVDAETGVRYLIYRTYPSRPRHYGDEPPSPLKPSGAGTRGPVLIGSRAQITVDRTTGGIDLAGTQIKVKGYDGQGFPVFDAGQLAIFKENFNGLTPIPMSEPKSVNLGALVGLN